MYNIIHFKLKLVMDYITIFTPTYNREKNLPVLYKSLLKQTYKNFEWLIVDDGSSDNTRQLVNSFIDENKIDIRYIYQKNSGKHIAFNTGVTNAKYNLFMCIDSDDYLVDDILCEIINTWKMVKKNYNTQVVCGLLAHRGKNSKETMFGEHFVNPYKLSTVRQEMENGYFETTMLHLTSILKEFPFPYFEGEKFLTEDIIWRQIDAKYKYYVVPKVWTICEYLQDGLTKTTNIFNYPNGEAEYFKVRYFTSLTIFEKLKEYSKYLVFKKEIIDDKFGRLFYLPAILLSLIYNAKWKMQFKGEN